MEQLISNLTQSLVHLWIESLPNVSQINDIDTVAILDELRKLSHVNQTVLESWGGTLQEKQHLEQDNHPVDYVTREDCIVVQKLVTDPNEFEESCSQLTFLQKSMLLGLDDYYLSICKRLLLEENQATP